MIIPRIAVAAAFVVAGAVSASAQTANSASPSGAPGGSNEAPQFPSGGVTAPNGTASPNAGKSQIGAPTAVEQEEQKKSDQEMTICKGC